MKHSNIYAILGLTIVTLIGLFSCETEFENPNAATSDQTYSTREGITAAAVGMLQLYSTTGMRWIIETPAITTREGGITTTFQNMIELEDGGSELPNSNSNVEGLWSTMLRVMKICEEIESNAPNIELNPGTNSGLIALAKLFKAMAIGSLTQSYEQVVVNTDANNSASFVSRTDALAAAINLLNEARSAITSTAVSSEFESTVTLSNIDLLNTINAYSARYHLFAGNYEMAISAAMQVDQLSTSVFTYDTRNLNPIWRRVFENNAPNFKPRDNFGLSADFVVDPNDARLSFYLAPMDDLNQNNLPIDDLIGFFDVNTKSIPLYLPDEMNLIIAEANLRKSSPNIGEAISALNEVLTDTDDPFELNAGLDPYSGDQSVEALLNEVFKNRRIELFLTGLSLEDSRRFNRPQPSGESMNFDEERNRNYYPYPITERNSNSNTPADPSI